jgi:hypothetical protein
MKNGRTKEIKFVEPNFSFEVKHKIDIQKDKLDMKVQEPFQIKEWFLRVLLKKKAFLVDSFHLSKISQKPFLLYQTSGHNNR